jgi:pilus assembly protein Flp/PilA
MDLDIDIGQDAFVGGWLQALTTTTLMLNSSWSTKMRKFSQSIARYLSVESEKGVTAIEYGLIASLIAVVIIVAVAAVGTQLTAIFNLIATKLTPA